MKISIEVEASLAEMKEIKGDIDSLMRKWGGKAKFDLKKAKFNLKRTGYMPVSVSDVEDMSLKFPKYKW
jgi:hypothetical protein